MVSLRILQSRKQIRISLILLLFSTLAVAANEIQDANSPGLNHPAVLITALLVVLTIALGWSLMFIGPSGVRFARLSWTLGVVILFAHIPLAFWLAHGWSHTAAVDHVRDVGGYGSGIVANYLFAIVWTADVVWWWSLPRSRERRPRWVGWAVNGFLAFIVLNATVIFGAPERRLVYAAFFLILLVAVACKRRQFTRRS